MGRKVMRVVGIVMTALVVVGARAQDDLNETTLFLTFVPNVQFAPVYVALESGYFEEAGFAVTIEHGDEPLGVDLIAAGERDFGVIGGEQVITARANERPVVFVYQWYQQFPVGVAVTHESGITSAADLRGQRVGIPGRFGASYSGLVALLAANDLTEQDIQLEEIGFNAPEVVCVGAISASVVYVNNEPLQINNRAEQDDCGDVSGMTVLTLPETANMVSNGLVTSEAMIAEQPDEVKAFVGAFDRGLRDAIENPARAYLMSTAYVENLAPSDALRAALEAAADEQAAYLAANHLVTRDDIAERRVALYEALREDFSGDELLQFNVLLTTIDLWDADVLGTTEAQSWEQTQDTLLAMDFLDTPIALESAYTNDFLPALGTE